MSRRKRWLWIAVSGAFGAVTLIACQAQPKPTTTVTVTRIVVETAVPQTIFVTAPTEPDETATAEPSPRKDLVVCTHQEPNTLYPYGKTLPIETAVLHALYENDYTTLTYAIQPQGLMAIPSLAADDAQLLAVEVQSGDTIVNAAGHIATLTTGMVILSPDGSEIVFDGTTAVMPQLVVDFTMQQRYWSDGQPVTAADSVYSFQLDADPDTPTSKFVTARTASYQTTGELSVRWTGIPGFWDTDYAIRFWRPLPRHLWESYAAANLLTEEISSRQPVGDGPFVVAEWMSGDHILLEPNPYYYHRDDDLPYLDSVTFRFLPDNNELVKNLLIGQCDVVLPIDLDTTQIPLLLAAETNKLIAPHFQSGTIYEHIDFGINSWRYYGDGDGRPDWFEDVRVRQAITMCTDRQGMIDEILYGRSQLIHSYIPSNHPLYPANLTQWPYDPQAANTLLDSAGYKDNNGDGIRQDPISDTSFRITLGTGDNEIQQQITQKFQADLRDCGIIVETYYLPADDWYADGPDSPLFGRHFDLGEFAWQAAREPACFLYTAQQITGPTTEKNRATGQPHLGWNTANATGWSNPEYDEACKTAQRTLPGMSAHTQSHQLAQQIYAQNLPSIPLFSRLKVAATQPNIKNFQIDPTQSSALWNLYEIDIIDITE